MKTMVSYQKKTVRMAFTLIELLVVIAVISVLLILIYPAFSRAVRAAKEASCLSNVRLYGAAMFNLMADQNRMLPAMQPAEGGPGGSLFRYGTYIKPYLAKELRCPLKLSDAGYYTGNRDLSLNAEYRKLQGLKTAKNKLIMAAENYGDDYIHSTTHFGMTIKRKQNHGTPSMPRLNVFFVDGHAATVTGPHTPGGDKWSPVGATLEPE